MAIGSEGVVGKQLAKIAVRDEGYQIPPRLDRYGNAIVANATQGFDQAADEGAYFVVTNPTPGTPINYAIQATFSDIVAAFTWRNADGVGGKRMQLRYARLIAGATVPASATAGDAVLKTDNIIRASAGTVLTPQNVNADAGNSSIADVRWTPTVAAAGASARLLARAKLRSVILVAGDEIIFVFGAIEQAAAISDMAGATAKRIIVPMPPCIIGPGQTALLHLWFTANAATAGQFEFDAGHMEK